MMVFLGVNMWLLLGEALFALLIIVFIMWWTLKGVDTPHQAHTKQAVSKPEPSSKPETEPIPLE
jgi:hypothetical protein